MPNRIPDGGEPHAARTDKRELEAAGLTVPPENLLVELERPGQELASITNDLLHALPKFFES